MHNKVRTKIAALTVALVGSGGCQDYDYVFQPDADREGTHLRFIVQQPSKADIVFVIDNSRSMREEQDALKASIGQMLDLLAPRDTSYRIGIVSTDAHGYLTTCCTGTGGTTDDELVPLTGPNDTGGNLGACGSCMPASCLPGVTDCCFAEANDCTINLRRPHDGVNGRLIAAFDPAVFKIDAVDVNGNPLYVDENGAPLAGGSPICLAGPLAGSLCTSDDQCDDDPPCDPMDLLDAVECQNRCRSLGDVLAGAFPIGLTTGPAGYAGNTGVPWVIDRKAVNEEACSACECSDCEASDTCFETCAQPIAKALVTAYFNANVNGLGTNGWGWEEGIRAGLMSVGVEPRFLDDQAALNPGSDVTGVRKPNSFATLCTQDLADDSKCSTVGQPTIQSWVRDDALLAIMFVSDEEDCSMPDFLQTIIPNLESNSGLPAGGFCYQSDKSQFLPVPRMAKLLEDLKGSRSRIAIGFIGGARNGGPNSRREATPVDCVATVVPPAQQPSNACSCLTNGDPKWCNLTQDISGAMPTCDALAGTRYVEFAEEFGRKTFDSVCRSGETCNMAGVCEQAFGAALEDFALIATLACFDLDKLSPAAKDPNLITVRRTAKDDIADPDIRPTLMPMVDPNDATVGPDGGWYYDDVDNKVCLVGLDRLLGDRYDIFVLHTNELNFNR